MNDIAYTEFSEYNKVSRQSLRDKIPFYGTTMLKPSALPNLRRKARLKAQRAVKPILPNKKVDKGPRSVKAALGYYAY